MTATGMAWISQRTDVLCATFYLLGLLCARRYLETGQRRELVQAGLVYAAALASKEMAITFPAVVLSYAIVTGRLHRALRVMIPLVALSLFYVVVWMSLFQQKLASANLLLNLSAVSIEHYWSSFLRLLALVFLPAFYPSHDYTYLSQESQLYLYGGATLFLLAGGLLLRWGKKREKYLFILGTVWLVLTVIPLYNLPHPDFLRLGYLPAAGAAMALAAVLSYVRRLRLGKGLAPLLLLIGLLRAVPIDQQILDYWGPHGDLVQLVNRYKQADADWQARIGPGGLAIFKQQLEGAAEEREHVERLLAGKP
jgi:hypothetical protein